MIYDQPAAEDELTQGDILDDCPILFWQDLTAGSEAPESASMRIRVVVLTQACHLVQVQATRVLVHQVPSLAFELPTASISLNIFQRLTLESDFPRHIRHNQMDDQGRFSRAFISR
jgi:hypothetical protein